MRRHELTDEQFAIVEPHLPASGTVGHPWEDHRRILNGIFWKLHTGAQWRDIPERYGPWSTIYDRHRRWCQDGTWDRILSELQIPLDENGQIDWEQWWIDSTNVRATRAAAGARKTGRPANEPEDHALGRSRGGFGTKLHLLCDRRGVPLAAGALPGQAHESTQFEPMIERVRIPRRRGRPRRRPRRLGGDRAYHAGRIRMWLRRHGIGAVIPPKRARGRRRAGRPVSYDAERYRGRSVIECGIGFLKECRSIATRYEKLALHYLGLVKLAIIEHYLHLLSTAPSAGVT